MSASLMRAGFSLTVAAHRSRAPLERLVAAGATDGGSAKGVAAASEIVVLCVPDAPQVEEALFAPDGVAAGAARGTLVIDCSTIAPTSTQAFGERLRERGIAMVDAPVSGGPTRAASGSLAIMAGGSPADFARAEPVLKGMGNPRRCGELGAGEMVKLVNQTMASIIMLANVEGFVLARKAGVDLDVAKEILSKAVASNYLMEQWLPKTWFGGTFDGGFALDLMRKDIRAALATGRALGVPMFMLALGEQLYQSASSEGHGRDDYSSVAAQYERAAQLVAGQPL
ncbi:MAG: NAD(P)-dependent oxidoreductase [bacterium]|nr:NAD(P)-dependent oxidoreductase [bacterium]